MTKLSNVWFDDIKQVFKITLQEIYETDFEVEASRLKDAYEEVERARRLNITQPERYSHTMELSYED